MSPDGIMLLSPGSIVILLPVGSMLIVKHFNSLSCYYCNLKAF